MLLRRFLIDILFLFVANAFVLASARSVVDFVHDPRGVFLLGVLNILWLLPAVGDLYLPPRKIRVTAKDHYYYLTMSVLLIEFVAGTYEYTRFRMGNIPRLETYSACVVIASGFLLSLIAWLSIKRYSAPRFQIIQGHRVVDTGAYQYIRHPICLSLFLIAAGVPILLRSLAAFTILALVVVPVWTYLIKEEEKFLLAWLGVEYQTYMERTKKFVPFLY